MSCNKYVFEKGETARIELAGASEFRNIVKRTVVLLLCIKREINGLRKL